MIEILSYKQWAIAESFFNSVAPTIYEWLATGHGIDRFVQKKTMAEHEIILAGLLSAEDHELKAGPMAMGFDQSIGLPVIASGNKKVAVIPVTGAITKYGEMCSYGTKDYQAMLARANSANHIDATLMVMDSPGGSVDGTQELATAVRDSSKPVGVFVDGLMASAAYWIGSQANAGIIANKNNTNIIGSIGTYGLYQNISEKLSKDGIQMKIIRAKQSVNKVAVNPLEPLTTELESALKDNVTAINQVFIDYVKAGRPGVDTKVFEAGEYNNQTAKTAGLIDGVGTMQTAVNRLLEKVKMQNMASQQPSTNSSARAQVNTMKFPTLSKLFSGEAWGKVLSAFTDNEASLEATEQKVAAMEASVAQLNTEASAKDAKITSLEATVAGLNTQVTSLTAEKATLSSEKAALETANADLKTKLDAKPTGQATTVISKEEQEATVNADGSKSATEANKYLTSVDARANEIREANAKNSTIK